MKQAEVLNDLIEKTTYCLETARYFKSKTTEDLKQSDSEKSWNVLQCLEHCNRYGYFYLPEFTNKVEQAKKSNGELIFEPGYWGKKFTTMMLPQNGKIKRMNAFKSKNPKKPESTMEALDVFIEQQQTLLNLLNESKNKDINSVKCKLTIPLIKMNLGATLQFIIFHNVRHIEQAKRTLAISATTN